MAEYPRKSPDKRAPDQGVSSAVFNGGSNRYSIDTNLDQEEDSDYDSEMDDFIDDADQFDTIDRDLDRQARVELERTLKEKFRYDKDKFKNERYDRWTDRQMVAGYGDIEAEEARSLRIAKLEDERELLREQGLLDTRGTDRRSVAAPKKRRI